MTNNEKLSHNNRINPIPAEEKVSPVAAIAPPLPRDGQAARSSRNRNESESGGCLPGAFLFRASRMAPFPLRSLLLSARATAKYPLDGNRLPSAAVSVSVNASALARYKITDGGHSVSDVGERGTSHDRDIFMRTNKYQVKLSFQRRDPSNLAA